MPFDRGRFPTPKLIARADYSEQKNPEAPYVDLVRILGLAINLGCASTYWPKAIVRRTLCFDRSTEIAQDCFWWFRPYEEYILHMNVSMYVSGSMKSYEAVERTSKAVFDR